MNTQAGILKKTFELIPTSVNEGRTMALRLLSSITHVLGHFPAQILQAFDVEDSRHGLHMLLQDMTGLLDEGKSLKREINKIELIPQSKRSAEQRMRLAALKEEQKALGELIHHRKLEMEVGKRNLEVSERLARLTQTKILIPLLALQRAASAESHLNQAIIQANASYGQRLAITNSIYHIQKDMGASNAEIAESAVALVNYGMEAKSSFRENLKVVQMMNDGLGVSVQSAAELAHVWTQQLQLSTEEVATTISRIVDDTALAAEEATKYAISIGRSMGALKKGVFSAELEKGITDYMLQLEAASKQTLGTSGEFTDMFKRMTGSVDGIRQAAILGIGDVRSMTPEKMTKGLEHVAQQLEAIGSNQAQRVALAEQYSRILGISVETLLNLPEVLESMRELDKQRASTMDIEERWRKQMVQAGSALEKLKNSALALIYQSLTPLVKVLSMVAEVINWVLRGLISCKPVFIAASIALTVGVAGAAIIAAKEAWGLGRALAAMALSARLAARQITGTKAAGFDLALDKFLTKIGSPSAATAPAATAASAGFFSKVKSGFKALGTGAVAAAGALSKDFFGTLRKWFASGTASLRGGLKNVVTQVVSTIKGRFSQLIRFVGSGITKVLTGIGGVLKWLVTGTMGPLILIGAAVATVFSFWHRAKKLEEDTARKRVLSLTQYNYLLDSLVLKKGTMDKDTDSLKAYIERIDKKKTNRNLMEQAKDFETYAEQVRVARDAHFAQDQVLGIKSPTEVQFYGRSTKLQEEMLKKAEISRQQAEEQARKEQQLKQEELRRSRIRDLMSPGFGFSY